MKIGILGQGYVGSAIKIGFEKHYKDINTFDKYSKSKSTVSNLEELTKSSEIIFVCLPTPMKENGECDIGIALGFSLSFLHVLMKFKNKINILQKRFINS